MAREQICPPGVAATNKEQKGALRETPCSRSLTYKKNKTPCNSGLGFLLVRAIKQRANLGMRSINSRTKARVKDTLAKAELRFLYPIATVSEPSDCVVSGDGLEGFADSSIQRFRRARFGGAQVLQTAMNTYVSNGWRPYLRSVLFIEYQWKIVAISAPLGNFLYL